MKQLNEKDIKIIKGFRTDSRQGLTKLSRKIKIPVSTIYDRYKKYVKTKVISPTCLVDFSKLGFEVKSKILLKVDKEKTEKLLQLIKYTNNINSAYRINNGFNFLIEVIFKNLKELDDFVNELDELFSPKEVKVYQVIEDIKTEEFLKEQSLVNSFINKQQKQKS